MAFKTMLPLQQLCVGGDQSRAFDDGGSRNEAVGGVFVQSFQSNRKYTDFTINGILNQTGGQEVRRAIGWAIAEAPDDRHGEAFRIPRN